MDSEMPPIPPEDLQGSVLGESLRPYLNTNTNVEVAPTLGVNFVEPWPLIKEEK